MELAHYRDIQLLEGIGRPRPGPWADETKLESSATQSSVFMPAVRVGWLAILINKPLIVNSH